MQSETRVYSLPRWRVTRWLADCGPGVPHDIRVELIGNLFGNLPVFAGGVINTLAVAIAIAARKPTAPFIAWVVFEIAVCAARLVVLLIARRAARKRADTPTDIYLVLAGTVKRLTPCGSRACPSACRTTRPTTSPGGT